MRTTRKTLPCHSRESDNDKGFTLIELSIVLTIIALIVGGIIVGQAVIRNAQLQSVITDVDKYKKAIELFKEKYHYLPGDMPTATSFWGANTQCPNFSITTLQTPTCNGNGNGRIDSNNGSESVLAWQHLANAGFISGLYSGQIATLNPWPGQDCPATKAGSCFNIVYAQDYIGVGGWQNWQDHYPMPISHILSLGNFLTTHSFEYPTPPLTVIEVLSIDSKIDDGLPATGKVSTRYGFCLTGDGTCYSPSPCVTNGTLAAQYNVTNSAQLCNVDFMMDF